MPLRLSALLHKRRLRPSRGALRPASAAVHLSQVGTFTTPVYVTAAPGDPHRLFVVEQAGQIMEVVDGQKQATPFLDISRDVKSGGEQGLLSMAFAPDYATSGRYYVYYTAPRPGDSNGCVITVDEVSPAGRRTVFTVDHPTNANHNGGQLQFGPDGMLYAGTGDGGSGNDPPNNAQNLGVKLGKLLRVDPLSAGAANPEIYAYGLRNPFRFSFDRQTGDLIIGDVGQGQREEVDFAAAGTAAGINYGWHCWEGDAPDPGISPACDPPNDVFPVLEKNHGSDGFCAIIGGYVARDAVARLARRPLPVRRQLQHAHPLGHAARRDGDVDTGLDVPALSSFGEDSCGHVYVTSLNGPVSRIDGDAFTPCPETPTATPPPTPTPGTPDTRAPVIKLGSLRRQPALRLHGFRAAASCDELCGATVKGTVRIKGSKRIYLLTRVTRQIGAGKRVKLTLRASVEPDAPPASVRGRAPPSTGA